MRDIKEVGAVVFDLDDTLAPSKQPLSPRMGGLLAKLLEATQVCVISGGHFGQFRKQVVAKVPAPAPSLARLHLMPTCGSRYYRHSVAGWGLVHADDIALFDRRRIGAVLEVSARRLDLWPESPWGPVVEDRGSQVTFSALGQMAPVRAKKAWDPDGAKRRVLRERAASVLAGYEVRVGGSTSVDVTKAGVDKASGVRLLLAELGLGVQDLLFFGDRLEPGGNDHPVRQLGVECVAVESWQDTADHLDRWLGAES